MSRLPAEPQAHGSDRNTLPFMAATMQNGKRNTLCMYPTRDLAGQPGRVVLAVGSICGRGHRIDQQPSGEAVVAMCRCALQR